MLNGALEPARNEVSPLSSCSLIPETKDRADIQTPSSGDISLKHRLFYSYFVPQGNQTIQEGQSDQQTKVICNGPLATDL